MSHRFALGPTPVVRPSERLIYTRSGCPFDQSERGSNFQSTPGVEGLSLLLGRGVSSRYRRETTSRGHVLLKTRGTTGCRTETDEGSLYGDSRVCRSPLCLKTLILDPRVSDRHSHSKGSQGVSGERVLGKPRPLIGTISPWVVSRRSKE